MAIVIAVAVIAVVVFVIMKTGTAVSHEVAATPSAAKAEAPPAQKAPRQPGDVISSEDWVVRLADGRIVKPATIELVLYKTEDYMEARWRIVSRAHATVSVNQAADRPEFAVSLNCGAYSTTMVLPAPRIGLGFICEVRGVDVVQPLN